MELAANNIFRYRIIHTFSLQISVDSTDSFVSWPISSYFCFLSSREDLKAKFLSKHQKSSFLPVFYLYIYLCHFALVAEWKSSCSLWTIIASCFPASRIRRVRHSRYRGQKADNQIILLGGSFLWGSTQSVQLSSRSLLLKDFSWSHNSLADTTLLPVLFRNIYW